MKQILPRTARRALWIAAALSAFILFWAIAAALTDKPFLPSPAAVARAFGKQAENGTLARHTLASTRRVLLAVAAAFLPAAGLGLAAGRSRFLDALVSPVVYILHPLPKVAFLPIILLLMGLGEESKVFLVGLIIFSQVLVTARDSSRRIPKAYLDSVRAQGASRISEVLHVVLPAALPDLLTSLRISLGTAIAVLFLAETIATEDGLGWLIVDAWSRIAYPDMYAAILALSLVGLAAFLAVDLAERVLCAWNVRD